MFMKISTRQKGVTLIELAIILLILGILVVAVMPRFGNIFENYDAEALRAASNNINISVSEALNRNITLADIRTTRLNDIITVSRYGLSDDIQMANSGTAGTITVNKMNNSTVDKSATVLIDTSGRVIITAITGFSNFHIANGDIVAN